MTAELQKIPGYFSVSRDEAKQLIAPYLATDNYYLLRPTDGDAICTVCVSNSQKLVNYRLFQDPVTRMFYIRDSKFPTIISLIHHYQKYPLNDQVQTYLLYPVTAPEEQDEYVALVPPSNAISSSNRIAEPVVPNRTNTTQNIRVEGFAANDISNIPGVHLKLSKNDIPLILQEYIHTSGYYLIRPSVSSNGQYTISVICDGSVLNFKINTDPSTGLFFVTQKKKCSSIRELLEAHRTTALRSKARPGSKVYLVYPITVQDAQRILLRGPTIKPELPPPWQEFFNEQHKRPYYYNSQTGESVWERPKIPESPSRRPLPPQPNGRHPTMDQRRASEPKKKNVRELPSLPEKNSPAVKGRSSTLQPSPNTSRQSPRVQSKATPSAQPTLPPLPQKDSSLPPLPPKFDRPPVPIPSGASNVDQEYSIPPEVDIPSRRDVPPRGFGNIPPKGSSNISPMGSGNVPPLPTKEEAIKQFPDLPPKDLRSSPTTNKRRPNEYTETVIMKTTPPLPSKTLPGNDIPPLPLKVPSNSDPSPAPPLPSKVPCNSDPSPNPPLPSKIPENGTPMPPPPPPIQAGVPAPPPPPPAGGPPPPPPPPSLVPPSPTPPRPSAAAPPKKEPPPPSSGGRPFTAADLQLGKSLLNRRKEETDSGSVKPKSSGGGLHDVFSSALDERLGSIRHAMASDDDDTDVDEVDDEDWSD